MKICDNEPLRRRDSQDDNDAAIFSMEKLREILNSI